MSAVRQHWKILAVFALVHLLLLVWRFTYHPKPDALRVTFLDVGQGDAAIIESPGGSALVVDTGRIDTDGTDNAGRRILIPFLKSRGINAVGAILLSHPHADHIGGAAALLEAFPVGLLMDNGQDADAPLVVPILTAAQTHHTIYKTAQRGQEIVLDDGVILHILAPTEAERHGKVNNASMVLRLEYGKTVLLFTGDAEIDEEADLVASGSQLTADVLKVGHHGSDTSSTPEFLAAVHPRLAIVSVGLHNLYGHPRRDVLERLEAGGAKIYRTDKNGAVSCASDGNTVQCSAYHDVPQE